MTMTRPLPLNLTILGLGRWGTHLLRNFLALPGAEVVALVDPALTQLQALRDRHHLGEAVTCYDTWPQTQPTLA
jgi:predicted dehydrogenase